MEFYYTCIDCGNTYDMTPEHMLCPRCSADQPDDKPLRGILEVGFSTVENLPESITDLGKFTCVEKKYFPPIPVGNTPLWEPARLRGQTGFNRLFIKDDTLNPTGSLKDRASYLVAAFARKHGIKKIVVASTGNAASSMAGVGAAAGIDVLIFMPKTAPKAKQIQALQYGAEVRLVDGTYDEAFELAMEYNQKPGYLSRNTAYNPLTIEGKKTAALEIFLQMQDVPDFVFVPTGDGVILSGLYKGFIDLKKLGMISRIPVLYAVQAEGSAAIADALSRGDFLPVSAATIADSISVDVPKGGYYALKKLKEYHGRSVTVSDDEILTAQHLLASQSGLFAEPAASAAFAGFLKEKDGLPKDSSAVVLTTGNGLKDIEAAAKRV